MVLFPWFHNIQYNFDNKSWAHTHICLKSFLVCLFSGGKRKEFCIKYAKALHKGGLQSTEANNVNISPWGGGSYKMDFLDF